MTDRKNARPAGIGPLPVSLVGPVAWGGLAALLLVGLYLGVITAAESFSHALNQLRSDALWVFLVSAGLAIQVGVFARMRQLVRQAGKGLQVMTGVGTGASTVGMIACCAHHLTDIAPVLGLTAATAFLGRYRLAFVLVGLAMNAAGVYLSVKALRSLKRHLAAAAEASPS
ncbi:MAG: hypothetical protein ACM3ZA_01695 [Bacillota bacterium]